MTLGAGVMWCWAPLCWEVNRDRSMLRDGWVIPDARTLGACGSSIPVVEESLQEVVEVVVLHECISLAHGEHPGTVRMGVTAMGSSAARAARLRPTGVWSRVVSVRCHSKKTSKGPDAYATHLAALSVSLSSQHLTRRPHTQS